jgi:hypothetical protein
LAAVPSFHVLVIARCGVVRSLGLPESWNIQLKRPLGPSTVNR